MKFSSIVPSQDLQGESGLGALNFEVTVSVTSKLRETRNMRKWETKAVPKMVKSRKVHNLESMLYTSMEVP